MLKAFVSLDFKLLQRTGLWNRPRARNPVRQPINIPGHLCFAPGWTLALSTSSATDASIDLPT